MNEKKKKLLNEENPQVKNNDGKEIYRVSIVKQSKIEKVPRDVTE